MSAYFEEKKCVDCQHRCSVFNFLAPEELNLLNQHRFEVSFKAGEVISKQASAARHITTLVSGLAKTYIEGYNGKDLIMSIITPQSLIISPGMHIDQRHHFSTAALTDSTACFIEFDVLRKILRRNPDFVESYISDFSLRSISVFQTLLSLTQKQMHGRLADALLYLSDKIFKSNDFDMVLSRQEMADMTAMTKESVCRIFKQFRDEGIIRMNGNEVELLKKEMLEKISKTG